MDIENIVVHGQAGIAMAANIVDQGKRIEALQNLVREWRKFGQSVWEQKPLECRSLGKLERETAQLLREEGPSHEWQ